MLISGANEDVTDMLKRISGKFSVKTTDLNDFLGIRINQTKEGISLDLTKYINKVLEDHGMDRCNPSKIPVQPKITLIPDDKCTPERRRDFQSKLGCLLWIVKMRPDLQFVCNILSRVAHAPSPDAFAVIKNVFRYLKGTTDLMIQFNKTTDDEKILWGYTDASFGEQNIKAKSHGGAVFYWGSNLVSHYSRLQTLVATSTAESEMIEMTRAAKEMIYFLGLMKDLQFDLKTAPILFTDCKVALDALKSAVIKRRTKHLSTRMAFLKDLMKRNTIQILKVEGKDNTADLFTKSLARIRFCELRDQLYDPKLRRPVDMNVGMTSNFDATVDAEKLARGTTLDERYT